jgi:dCTP deaminase
MITPFVEHGIVRGMSFGLSCASYDIRIAESVTIHRGEFIRASTLERFDIPTDVLIVVHDKSSWARRGLSVFNTVFDPGWHGYATLELANLGKETLTILAGDPIAQVVCHLLTEPTTQAYAGKYQNQEAGPQPARSLGQSIDHVDNLSRFTVGLLRHAGMETLEQVSICTERDLRRHGMRKPSIREINEALARVGLKLKP